MGEENSRINEKRVKIFQSELLRWYKHNARSFPWREPGCSSYEILIAELLLQKTKAENIVITYNSFIKKFPDFITLLQSNEEELSKLLQPLGLYRNRAKSLLMLAEDIEEIGIIPMEPEILLKLPGMGPYIAYSYLVFAHNKRFPIVDTNIRRLYQRVFSIDSKPDPRRDHNIWIVVESTMPRRNYRKFLYAILDHSALVCKSRNPLCIECPLSKICDYYLKSC